MKKILAIIPARGGSKSIPKKNIIDLAGKPLIFYTIKAALDSKYITDVIVSSDSDEILEVSTSFGVKVLKRDINLAKDNTKTEEVLFDILSKVGNEYDDMILLQPTSPLRTSKHIDEAFAKYYKNDCKSLISVEEPSHSPLKAFLVNEKGFLKGIVNDKYPFMSRQSLPRTYYPNGAIYIISIKKFLNLKSLFISNGTSFFLMDNISSIDIDSIGDLEKAKIYLNYT